MMLLAMPTVPRLSTDAGSAARRHCANVSSLGHPSGQTGDRRFCADLTICSSRNEVQPHAYIITVRQIHYFTAWAFFFALKRRHPAMYNI
jgi:hypothetical protein